MESRPRKESGGTSSTTGTSPAATSSRGSGNVEYVKDAGGHARMMDATKQERCPTEALAAEATRALCPSSAARITSCGEKFETGSDTSSVQSSPVNSSPANTRSPASQRMKRKHRRSAVPLEEKDPETEFEPSAKRQQRLSSMYQSESGSIASSVYSASIDDFVNDIGVLSPSVCNSSGTEYDPTLDDIPDSPHSLHQGVLTSDDDRDDSRSASTATTTTTSSEKKALPCLTTPSTRTVVEERPISAQNLTPGGGAISLPVKSFEEFVQTTLYDCMTPSAETEQRVCPLPALSWANANDVWQLMCKKDERAALQRDSDMLGRHPGLETRMRAILLDWLIEVCEVYKLHRETYYLAVDFLDRYLSSQRKVQKTHLQLLGITSLFVAAKVEEIYPPKIGEFAYVTDGACTEADIIHHEILLLQALDWDVSPVTPIGWLGIYMQLSVSNRTPPSFSAGGDKLVSKHPTKPDDAFIYPQFSGMKFVQAVQLLDLCSLHTGMGQFTYSVLAAAAMSYIVGRKTALVCSGFDFHAISACVHWMEPFYNVISKQPGHLFLLEQNEQVASKFGMGHVCPNIVTDDSHIIQTHTITMDMFDRVYLLQQQYRVMSNKIKQEASPATGLIYPDGLLTPPASSRKPQDLDEEEDMATKSSAGVSGSKHDARGSS